MAILKDESKIEIDKMGWHDVKNKVKYLYFNNNEQIIYLPKNADEYGMSTTAAFDPSTGRCEDISRNLWAKIGNKTVKVIVQESDNTINIEVE